MSKNKEFRIESHEEAEVSNFNYYKNLSNDERIEIGLKLLSVYYGNNTRLEGIYRTAKLGECPVSIDWRMGSK